MNSETKICQNCKKDFIIEAEDFDFYKKMGVPPPTFCPDCRFQRRLVWRNQWHFYKKRDLFGKTIFSFFPPEAKINIYERDYWWSDKWDSMDYGRDYDWNKPFFEQFNELMQNVPLPARSVNDMVSSDYSNNAGYSKNCYLVFDANFCEDSSYCVDATHSKFCFDCLTINKSEFCYESFNINQCYRVFYSTGCESSQDLWFSRNCIGCSFCFGCANLRNKSYYIFNKPYSKEDYIKKIKELSASYEKIENAGKVSKKLWLLFPYKYVTGRHNYDTTGDYISYSKNTKNSYRIVSGEDLKYCQMLQEGTNKDSMDYSIWGHNTERVYESAVCGQMISNIKFSWMSYGENKDLQYCIACNGSSDLFGCVGLRSKQYCIFNKQYSKNEYEELLPRIIRHMNDMPYKDKNGIVYKYGEFFPFDLSPFPYNETLAQEYFPISKDIAQKKSYWWRDKDKREYKISIQSEALPNLIEDAKDDIQKEIIGCAHEGKCEEVCTEAFVITPQEFSFYKTNGLPLPRLCPNCRMWQRINFRNPFKLYKKMCDCLGVESINSNYKNYTLHSHGTEKCSNQFETTFSPDRPEIVYCEQCYQAEVA